jgi:hypothetical protein
VIEQKIFHFLKIIELVQCCRTDDEAIFEVVYVLVEIVIKNGYSLNNHGTNIINMV